MRSRREPASLALDSRKLTFNWRIGDMNSRTVTRKVALAGGLMLFGIATVLARPAAAGCLDFKTPNKVGWQSSADTFGSFLKVSSEQDSWSWETPVRRAP